MPRSSGISQLVETPDCTRSVAAEVFSRDTMDSGTDAKPGGRMSNETYDPNPSGENQTGDMNDPEEYGGLSVEDDPQGTVDPAELAGTADESDEDVS